MNILFCSPEVYPFSKAGGVADFSASLPKAISKLNNKVYVVTPYYSTVKENFGDLMEYVGERDIVLDDKVYQANYYRYENDNIVYLFVSHDFFDRKRFFGHDDDIKRFMFFNLAILELLSLINYYPDIIHINDWSTSLIPYFLTTHYNKFDEYKDIKTLLTIHNLEKQGSYNKENEYLFKVKNFTYLHLEKINFLKTGIMRSNKINTVSKSYKNEILTKFFGFSLDGALKSRQLDLLGIQNGLDFDTYNPNTDKFIFKNYDVSNYKEGKDFNKKSLVKEFGFTDPDKMLVSFVSRFAKEKGVGLIMDVIDDFLVNEDINFIVIGEGDLAFEDFCEELSLKYPNSFKYFNKHNFKMGQKIIAASDLLLHPSLYEASGLNQMIAMRYGTVPLVRETGGLKDTVIDSNDNFVGTGLTFENFDSNEFKAGIKRALNYYNNNKDFWNKIIVNAMNIDNDIETMAKNYNDLYLNMIK